MTRGATTRKRGAPHTECCVEKRSAQKVFEECRVKKKSAKSRQRSADGNWGAPILEEECRNGCEEGRLIFRCANPGRESPMGIEECSSPTGALTMGSQAPMSPYWGIGTTIWSEECWSSLSGSQPRMRSVERGVQSTEWIRGAPIQIVGIMECQSQWRRSNSGGIACGMESKSINLGWGALIGFVQRLSL